MATGSWRSFSSLWFGPDSIQTATILAATTGQYSITGSTTSLTKSYSLAAATGNYSITGSSVTGVRTYTAQLAAGNYSVSRLSTNL